MTFEINWRTDKYGDKCNLKVTKGIPEISIYKYWTLGNVVVLCFTILDICNVKIEKEKRCVIAKKYIFLYTGSIEIIFTTLKIFY